MTSMISSDNNKDPMNFNQERNQSGSVIKRRSTIKNLDPSLAKRVNEQEKLIKQLQKTLSNMPPNMEIWHIQNDSGVSLLHQAAIKDQAVIFRKLLKIAKDKVSQNPQYQQQKVIQIWVNK